MSEYLRGMDISQYTEGQVTAICEYFKNQGTPLSVAQVELTGGTTDDAIVNGTAQSVKDVIANGLYLGYYAFLYPYLPGYHTIEQQANEFVSVYKSLGIKPHCKIMVDIEEDSFTQLGIDIEKESENNPQRRDYFRTLINEMLEEFTNIVDSQLGKQEYVVYASLSFINEFFTYIDTEKYGLIISDVPFGVYSMDQVTYPEYPATPIGYNPSDNNWGNNWTGLQFKYGNAQDYDVYTNNILISELQNNINPILFKNGDYVKLKPNTLLFAPNKIPSTDKGPQYIVCDVNGNDYKLHPINQWVTGNELKLIKSYSPENNTPQSNNLSKGWDGLDLLTKAALYIGSNEGFGQNDDGYPWDGNTIGYSTSNYQQYSNGPLNIPISQEEGIELVINYLKANINTWNNDITSGGLNLSELSDNQLIALYDFGYETGGGDHLLLELCQCIATRSDAYNPTFGSFLKGAGAGVQARRYREWQTYFSGKIHFGGAVNELPSQYINIVENLQ